MRHSQDLGSPVAASRNRRNGSAIGNQVTSTYVVKKKNEFFLCLITSTKLFRYLLNKLVVFFGLSLFSNLLCWRCFPIVLIFWRYSTAVATVENNQAYEGRYVFPPPLCVGGN